MTKTNKTHYPIVEQLAKYYPYGTHKVLAIELGIKDSDLSNILRVHDELMKRLEMVAIPKQEYKDMKELIRLLKKCP